MYNVECMGGGVKIWVWGEGWGPRGEGVALYPYIYNTVVNI